LSLSDAAVDALRLHEWPGNVRELERLIECVLAPNWMGIAIRLTFAAFLFSQGDGFVPMGIWDGVSGLLLLFTYLPVVRSAAPVSPARVSAT
jgi:hypothetical protein